MISFGWSSACSAEMGIGLNQWILSPPPTSSSGAENHFIQCPNVAMLRNGGVYRLQGLQPLRVHRLEWDPDGLLGPPRSGHISRRSLEKSLQKEQKSIDILEKEARVELEKRRAAREARIVPKEPSDLINFFLETDARDIEYEIARCRPRLTDDFFSHLEFEMGSLRFAIQPSKEIEERLVELEVLCKVLKEGVEAYDRMATDLIGAKDCLVKILVSKDRQATLLEMVEKNELNRALLSLLDANITAARSSGEEQAVLAMEKVRMEILKYLTF